MEPAGELWEGLSARERAQVAACCPDRHYPRGTVIFGPGHPPDALYVLLSGLVTLSYLTESGQESILRIFGPGDVFGVTFLTADARPFVATASTPCTVTVVPGTTFLRLLSTIPRLGLNLNSILSRRFVEMALARRQTSRQWSFHRLVLTLLHLGATHGVAGEAATVIALPLTHQILADMIGASRETVSRHLGRLKRLEFVRQQGRTLSILPAPLKSLVPDWPTRQQKSDAREPQGDCDARHSNRPPTRQYSL